MINQSGTSNRISVIIPTYNYRNYVIDAIESVFGQTVEPFEVIVVDDGSSDDTCVCLGDRYGDRIKYFRKANGGNASALNAGIQTARGDFVCCLSADDMYLPTALESLLRVFEKHPNVELAYGDWAYMNESKHRIMGIRTPFFKDRDQRILWMFRYCYFNYDVVMFRKSLFSKVGLFDESLISSEWDFWFRCLKVCDVGKTDTEVAFIRDHAGQITKKTRKVDQSRRDVLKKAHKLYGREWMIKRILHNNFFVCVFWMTIGIFSKSQRHGLYWGKRIIPGGDHIIELIKKLRFQPSDAG